MWLPVIEAIEEKLNEGKSKKDLLLEHSYVSDVFSHKVLERFTDAVFIKSTRQGNP